MLSEYTWDLAYGDYDENFLFEGFDWKALHIIKNPYKTKWFADPFILKSDPYTIELLVEEFDSSIKRGRIARIVIDRKTDTIIDCTILLDKQTHLSFPVIYWIDGKVIIHPENSASGKSYMYEYDIKSQQLINPIVIADVPLVDSIIRKENDVYRLYATRTPDTCGRLLDMYESKEFTGPYCKVEEIDYYKKEARMAGAFIETTSGCIRPAQDCNFNYGEAVVFYKGKEVISVLRPSSIKYEGIHTFNKKDDLFVIDLKKYKYSVLHFILKKINRFRRNKR